MGFTMFLKPGVLRALREIYPAGAKVELIEMHDPYREMPPGLRGEVTCVDDTGTVHVKWENGSSLGVVYGVDEIKLRG